MRKKPGILTFAWVLLGLLLIASSLLFLGSRDRKTDPSATSFNPSGVRAFTELLREAGYSVSVTPFTKPRLEKGDLAIAFALETELSWFPEGQEEEAPKNPTAVALRKHILEGGRALVVQMPANFPDATKLAGSGPHQLTFDRTVLTSAPATLEITQGMGLAPTLLEELADPTDPAFSAAYNKNDRTILEYMQPGKGILAVVRDGTGATNRFLDKLQNAEFFLWTVANLNPGKGRIVFVEALHSEGADPGLLRTIGAWAFAGWWQFVLLLGVVAFTLGKRFGLPETFRVAQRGGRELIDAYADTLRRARKPQVALQKIVKEVDREVRRKFNIAADLPPKRRNELLPTGLAVALSQAELAADEVIHDVAATRLLFALEDEMAGMRGDPHRRRRKRRR